MTPENCSVNEDIIFNDFYKFDWVKIVYLLINFTDMTLGNSLVFGMVWFEQYGSQLRQRMLTNQIASHVFIIMIFGNTIAYGMQVIFVIFGPFPEHKIICHLTVAFARLYLLDELINITAKFVSCVHTDISDRL